MPLERLEYTVEQTNAINAIENTLERHDTNESYGRVVSLTGHLCVDTDQLAADICYSHCSGGRYEAVAWLYCRSIDSAQKGFVCVSMAGQDSGHCLDIVRHFFESLDRCYRSWLVVLNNPEQGASSFVASGLTYIEHGSIIVTVRDSAYGQLGQQIVLHVLFRLGYADQQHISNSRRSASSTSEMKNFVTPRPTVSDLQ